MSVEDHRAAVDVGAGLAVERLASSTRACRSPGRTRRRRGRCTARRASSSCPWSRARPTRRPWDSASSPRRPCASPSSCSSSASLGGALALRLGLGLLPWASSSSRWRSPARRRDACRRDAARVPPPCGTLRLPHELARVGVEREHPAAARGDVDAAVGDDRRAGEVAVAARVRDRERPRRVQQRRVADRDRPSRGPGSACWRSRGRSCATRRRARRSGRMSQAAGRRPAARGTATTPATSAAHRAARRSPAVLRATTAGRACSR